MSFSFSAGDFLTTIQLANKIRYSFVNAPDQFRAISDEVKSLSNVLRDIEDVLPQRDLRDQRKAELEEIARGCQNVLRDLKTTLDRYQELDSSTRSSSGRSRRVWKRLQWDQKEIDEVRGRITSNVLLFNTFLGRVTNQATFKTKDNLDRLASRQLDQDQQAILDWLTPIDYGTQQSDFIGRRQRGTGEWLLNSAEFQRWIKDKAQTMFCSGIPGAGKTMMTSIIIEYLQTKFRDDIDISIAYLYCNFRRQDEQKPIDLIANLVKQLIQRRPSVPEHVRALHKCHKENRTRPSFDEILKVLRSVLTDYKQNFIIIDALDECQPPGSRREFLSEIFNCHTKNETNLLTTSRSIPEITNLFEEATRLEIRASDEDVQSYLNGHISNLPSCVLNKPLLQEEIKSEIMKAVDGMFLLAQLHLDSLVDKTTPKAIKSALKKLPRGSEAYNQAYEEAMKRIEGQKPGFRELAVQILSWITCTKRPLTTLELRHALAVEVGESELDEDNIPEVDDMLSVCAGLVTVDIESDIIRLVHYTTQDYFERTQRFWFPNAELDILKTCMTYLSFEIFESGFCTYGSEFEARLQSNPLYEFAAQNWVYFAKKKPDAQHQIAEFLSSEAHMPATSQATLISESIMTSGFHYSDVYWGVPKEMSGMHLAARFGLAQVVHILLENGHESDCADSAGRTPLSYAAMHGHEAVVNLFIERDDVDLDRRDDVFGQTPLSIAAENGHEAVVKLLVTRDDVDVNLRDEDDRTLLSCAAENGDETVVKLLLARDDIDVNSKDDYGWTSLSWAVLKGDEMVVKLLLTRDDIDINLKDEDGRTPLLHAADYGHEAVVKLLLTRDDIDVNVKDRDGQTPQSLAIENGHESIAKLLRSKLSYRLSDEE